MGLQSGHHYLVEFTEPPMAKHTGSTLLAPALDRSQQDGELGTWWFVRITVATFGGTAPLLISDLSNPGMAVAFFWYVAGGSGDRLRGRPHPARDGRQVAALTATSVGAQPQSGEPWQ
ncbi:hypothetical protein [Actinophytocola gossypii]|uniref:Amino acid permease/ SLC12A domain-containing protein n=1 Tax=Actinophytocola gossypii TaxID=2812003 RepID=A0ABT2JIK0_9PSEU|nr:hypothetical protein [Actinophytocola gossypii]